MTGMIADVGQGIEIAGVGQLVDVDHLPVGIADDLSRDGRTDEAGAAGD